MKLSIKNSTLVIVDDVFFKLRSVDDLRKRDEKNRRKSGWRQDEG